MTASSQHHGRGRVAFGGAGRRLGAACALVLVAATALAGTNNPVITLNPAGAAAATNALRDIRGPVVIPTGWMWLRRILMPLVVLALLSRKNCVDGFTPTPDKPISVAHDLAQCPARFTP